MIDTDVFYQALGAKRPMGPDEQLLLQEGIRVFCESQHWTLFFENARTTEAHLQTLFDCARQDPHLIPLRTRSGWLALRSPCVESHDETAQALKRFSQALERLGNGFA